MNWKSLENAKIGKFLMKENFAIYINILER